MSLPLAYIDTSAFVKRFLAEAHTPAIEAFIADSQYRLMISSLSLVELSSVLKRKLRLGEVAPKLVALIDEQVRLELASKALALHVVEPTTFELASSVIERLTSPLSTLDSIHLASAKAAQCSMMVSADKQLVKAAHELGLQVLDLT
jgi:predicted nucleic acid-binding protein